MRLQPLLAVEVYLLLVSPWVTRPTLHKLLFCEGGVSKGDEAKRSSCKHVGTLCATARSDGLALGQGQPSTAPLPWPWPALTFGGQEGLCFSHAVSVAGLVN